MRKGLSLIELIISITLIAILIIPIVLLFNKTIRVFHSGNPSYKVFFVINDAMNEITDIIRQAESIEISEETKVGFIIPINEGIDDMKITLSADTGNHLIIREGDNGKSYVPYYNTPDTPEEERVLIKLEFTYYGEGGTELSYGDSDKVKSVKILISGVSASDPEKTSHIEMVNMVTLRNRD